MIKRVPSVLSVFSLLGLITLTCLSTALHTVSSFEQLASYHCRSFPMQTLIRLSSGTLAEIYGAEYAELDCYVRQFVNSDGQNKEEFQSASDEEQQQEQENNQQETYTYPQVDPLVKEYSKGLKQCIPEGYDPVQTVYKVWRFYRFTLQHDYAYEWMRAKIRSGIGYEAERPNSWMDGQQNEKRLRLDKLFSNEFYNYVDKLMFRDFLFPLMTFWRKNVVVGIEGQFTQFGFPLLLQFIESRNFNEEIFIPVVFASEKEGNTNSIFSYTLPGIPLLLGGSSIKVDWAFTGVLVDRSNVQQIETVGNKFYHHGLEEWIKLDNVTENIPVHEGQTFQCRYIHSSYGTLYQKHNRSGKISEYIVRWHQNEPAVRNLFSELYNLILNEGNTPRQLQFPFNSLVVVNSSGVYHHLCPQFHPSYFIYPDLASQPDPLSTRWIQKPKKGMLVVSNTHLTTVKQESYIKKEVMNVKEQQILSNLKALLKKGKISSQKLWETTLGVATDSLVKKRKEHLIFMYRKAKFVFFPEEPIRKQCDQLISILEKWDNNFSSQLYTPIFVLWDYFFREYTFNHISSSVLGAQIVKHHLLTDNYWTGQPELWKKGISYGECDTHQWTQDGWDVRLNGTGLNSTCFLNVMRGINRTRQIIRTQDGKIRQDIKLSDFTKKKTLDLTAGFVGNNIDQAFGNYYSRNLAFVAEAGSPHIRYLESYLQLERQVDLSQVRISKSPERQEQIEDQL